VVRLIAELVAVSNWAEPNIVGILPEIDPGILSEELAAFGGCLQNNGANNIPLTLL
jgi:hypothetical protein